MKILLLGKSGQVGWELQRALAPLGDLTVVGRDGPGPSADFSKPESAGLLVRTLRPDVVVNAVAYTAVDKAESEPALAHAVNATAPGHIAREVAALGGWLIHYSTDYVFDGSGRLPWTESSVPAPLSVYGHSKLAGERAIQASGCKHLIFRTSWVFAAKGQNFARTVLALARDRDRLRMVSDQIGAPTGADLLADLTSHAMRAASASDGDGLSGTYHAVAAGETSWHGYARHVIQRARELGLPIRAADEAIEAVPSSAFPTAAARPHNSRLDCTRLRNTFGLHLPAWQVGVDRMLSELAG